MNIAEKKYSVEGLQQFPSFNQVEVSNCELNILVGYRDFQFCINEASSKEGLLVKRIGLTDIKSVTELLSVLDNILDDHPSFLKFWSKIKVGFKSSSFTLVPDEYYDEASRGQYLSFSSSIDSENSAVLDDFNTRREYHLLYSVPKTVKEWFENKFDGRDLEFYHQSGPLLRATIPIKELSDDSNVLVFQDGDQILVWYLNKGNLEFYNQFHLSSKDDFLKYINVVFHTLKLEKGISQLYIYGNAELSVEGKVLSKYFRNVNNGPIPAKLAGWQIEQSFPLRRYMDLLCLSLA